ncbi:hypothetical protein NPIL_216541 [Nephila pilipes]|uniref:Uncharacterized protein n=1 Tax=Nephila pilipes TaxID=299642 RepID=A0A8X6N4D7_NEPPI|nr:hypothetical protein NPIL_216541 [Nephila pilipes]
MLLTALTSHKVHKTVKELIVYDRAFATIPLRNLSVASPSPFEKSYLFVSMVQKSHFGKSAIRTTLFLVRILIIHQLFNSRPVTGIKVSSIR